MQKTLSKQSSLRVIAVAVAIFLMFSVGEALAHCQIPCGIYDDPARVATLKEDTKTIAKSVKEIHALAGKSDAQSLNQAARWVMNKETHASNIIEVMANYFLTQRVKPGEDRKAYLESLADHHAVIVAAMKAKQNASQETVDALAAAVDKLDKYYPPHKHKN